MEDAKLRAWWFHRQGLDGSLAGKTAAEVLAATGWARSVGGAAPYLCLFARAALSRESVDASAAACEIHELPSARGCTYVLPASDFSLGLRAAQSCWGADLKTVMKLGVAEGEIERLCDRILSALKEGPLDPEQIRERVGSAARGLGPEGLKKGVASTVPVALGKLQVSGDIRRTPVNGRLDQQRYRYTLWLPNPLKKLPITAEQANIELARRYFRWIGPATVSEFQWFSGLGVKAAKAAIEPLKLVPLDGASERWMTGEDREAFQHFSVPKKPRYILTAGLDAMALLRRDLSQLMTEDDRARSVASDGGRAMGGLADLPDHAILDRGRIVGLWEYDPESQSLAWWSFVKPDKALNEAVARMEEYVRTQLGDARTFSLDSPKSRLPRIEALRKAQAQH